MPYYYPTTQRRRRYAAPVRTRYTGSGAYQRRVYQPRRYARRIYGNGAYTYDNPGPYGRVGEFLGGHIGNYVAPGGSGRTYGSKVGRYIGHKVGKLFGSGAYTYDPNASLESRPVTLAPEMPKFDVRGDSVTIAHREYLGDIISSSTAGAFDISSFDINPASSDSFPWLSTIAGQSFQQYKFDGLIFEFRSFSADALNSTNTALGSVSACICYDYNDQNPQSRYDIENTDWSSACKPSENMNIPVECKPSQTGMNGLLYVLNTPGVPAGADPKTYFMGKMFIATQGFQGTSVNIGSLYVTYKIRLFKPVMTRPLA